MRRFLCSLLFTATLAGCSSGDANIPLSTTQTGKVTGDYAALYWLDERQDYPQLLDELVVLGDYGSYRSKYIWRAGVLREVMREGKVLIDNAATDISVHLRYDSNEEPVYQRYRENGELVPLSSAQLIQFASDAELSLASARQQYRQGIRLIQGHWQNGRLTECDSGKNKKLSFNDNIPTALTQQAKQADALLVGLGKSGLSTVQVETVIDLLPGHACLSRPDITPE